MRNTEEIPISEIIEVLNKCWMTHDGMWFLHSAAESGIETANRLNKAAIASLAGFEVDRLRKIVGPADEPIANFAEFKRFVIAAKGLFVPDFMGVSISFPRENVMHWEFENYQCFAYKGVKRMGLIDGYECGVIYRLEQWIKNLGIDFTTEPPVSRCLMHTIGSCSGNFLFWFR